MQIILIFSQFNHNLQFLRFTLDVLALSRSFGIEVYLYTKGNIIIPMETSGLYGIKYMKYHPMENSTYFERFFLYKNSIKRLKSTTLGCRNYEKEDSVGQCIVKFVEDTYNCTGYQIFANKLKDPCVRPAEGDLRRYHQTLGTLSEFGIYNKTKCLPNCEGEEIDVRSTGKPMIHSNERPVFSLEFQFESEMYQSSEEHILYDTDSFIADAGGYLGLLLGHSMLSIYRSVAEWLSESNIWNIIQTKLNFKRVL